MKFRELLLNENKPIWKLTTDYRGFPALGFEKTTGGTTSSYDIIKNGTRYMLELNKGSSKTGKTSTKQLEDSMKLEDINDYLPYYKLPLVPDDLLNKLKVN